MCDAYLVGGQIGDLIDENLLPWWELNTKARGHFDPIALDEVLVDIPCGDDSADEGAPDGKVISDFHDESYSTKAFRMGGLWFKEFASRYGVDSGGRVRCAKHEVTEDRYSVMGCFCLCRE
jgi:hypothetical protein